MTDLSPRRLRLRAPERREEELKSGTERGKEMVYGSHVESTSHYKESIS
jgi:hypothetical protein